MTVVAAVIFEAADDLRAVADLEKPVAAETANGVRNSGGNESAWGAEAGEDGNESADEEWGAGSDTNIVCESVTVVSVDEVADDVDEGICQETGIEREDKEKLDAVGGGGGDGDEAAECDGEDGEPEGGSFDAVGIDEETVGATEGICGADRGFGESIFREAIFGVDQGSIEICVGAGTATGRAAIVGAEVREETEAVTATTAAAAMHTGTTMSSAAAPSVSTRASRTSGSSRASWAEATSVTTRTTCHVKNLLLKNLLVFGLFVCRIL